MRADVYFAEKFGSRTKAAEAIDKGLVLLNGNEYSGVDVTLPIKYEFEETNESIDFIDSNMQFVSCKARQDIDSISIDAEISVVSRGTGKNEIIALDEIRFGERVEKNKNEITVCYLNAGEDLWSVAKKHHTNCSHIQKINNINGNIANLNYVII